MQTFANEPQHRPVGHPPLEHLRQVQSAHVVERPPDRLPTTTQVASLASRSDLLQARTIIDALLRQLDAANTAQPSTPQEKTDAAAELSRSTSTAGRPTRMEHARRGTTRQPREATRATQVENNRESTARQYRLAERAETLGWPRDQVTVIDEDRGVSGSGLAQRTGFARMTAEPSAYSPARSLARGWDTNWAPDELALSFGSRR